MIVPAKSIGKWVTQVDAHDSIERAARITLKPRLKAVQRLLKLAANRWRDDIEYVHQLRVQTRRALAAIELYREVLPERELRKIERWLNQIRKAAGEARDLDVLPEYLPQRKELELAADERIRPKRKRLDRLQRRMRRDIAKRRCRAQRPIVRLYRTLLVSGRFKKQSRKLLRRLGMPCARCNDRREPRPVFGQWAQCRFAEAADRFVSAAPGADATLKDWHRFRIRGKQLRYTMELVATVYDSGFRSGLYANLSELQERLGKATDHDQATRYLTKFASRTRKRRELKWVQAMITREQERLAVDLIGFQSWWMGDAEPGLKTWLRQYPSSDST